MFGCPAGNGLSVEAIVPRYKIRGETAVLKCNYHLEGALLYAVKWYRENEEFYRYVPKSDPQKTSYPVDGIRVDVRLLFFFFCLFSYFVYFPANFSLQLSPSASHFFFILKKTFLTAPVYILFTSVTARAVRQSTVDVAGHHVENYGQLPVRSVGRSAFVRVRAGRRPDGSDM